MCEANIQTFWDLVNQCSSVSISCVFFNGSSSFRPASDSQKRRFRAFIRQQLGQRKMEARAVDEEVRQRGVTQCAAVVFLFHDPPPSMQPDCLRFLLPVWQPKDAPSPSGLELGTLELVLLGLLERDSIEKLTFDAKELLCVLMRRCNWRQLDCRIQQLIDVQLASWLLSPNAREKDRVKYSLLSLLREHSENESDYPVDISDRPADIMRGLQVDLLDVLRLWSDVRVRLLQQRMLAVFMEQEMQLTPVLAEMQQAGICFDGDSFRKANKAVERRMMDMVALQPQQQQHRQQRSFSLLLPAFL